MTLNFSRSTYRFYSLKFRISASQIVLTSSLMTNGPNSRNLNPLDCDWSIRFGAMLESYHKLQPKPKSVPKFKNVL